jgi:hypothetical protein
MKDRKTAFCAFCGLEYASPALVCQSQCQYSMLCRVKVIESSNSQIT